MSLLLFQPVFECVRMVGPWIEETVRVTVQMASVEVTVQVSML